MEKIVETWVTRPSKPISSHQRNACLVHIYPTGQGMGTRYTLGNKPLVIGRGTDCDIRIHDYSVSRRHACIQPVADGYQAEDLQSTNGTYINDNPTTTSKLKDGDYLRIGNCIYRFLSSGNVEADYHEEIYRLTIVDALTDIYNKRYLLEFLERELARSARYKRPLSLVLFDLDRFKEVNDEFGHLAGDVALRELAYRLRGNIRREELFARYGGEEFVVVLPEATLDGAVELAERLRRAVAEQPFLYEDKTFSMTISVGVAATSGEENLTPDELISRADEKLYEAKDRGRNCVVS